MDRSLIKSMMPSLVAGHVPRNVRSFKYRVFDDQPLSSTLGFAIDPQPFDGKVVAAIVGKGTLVVWDSDSGKEVFKDDRRASQKRTIPEAVVAFSPSGKYLAAAYDGVRVDLYETDGWKLVATNDEAFKNWDPSWGDPFPSALAFSPDEKKLAWSQQGMDRRLESDGLVRVVTVPDLQPIVHLPEGSGTTFISFSSDGKILYTGGAGLYFNPREDERFPVGREPSIRAWDVRLWTIKDIVIDKDIQFGGFSTSAEKAITIGTRSPATVVSWDLKRLSKRGQSSVDRKRFYFCAVYPDGEWAVANDYDQIIMIHAVSGAQASVIDLSAVPKDEPDGARSIYSGLLFSKDGRRFAFSADRGGLYVYDVSKVEK